VGFDATNQSDPRAHAHEKLLDLLHSELGDLLAIAPPNTDGPLPPFSKYQNGPGRVLVFYGKKGFANEYPFVWPPLNQVWADARYSPQLMSFLQDAMNKLPFKRQMWAAMAELTPSAYDVIFNFAGSLRKLAEEVWKGWDQARGIEGSPNARSDIPSNNKNDTWWVRLDYSSKGRSVRSGYILPA